MNRLEFARRLTELLELESPPIGISFAETPPAGVKVFEGEVPSPCALWRIAERSVFFAGPRKHLNCAVGAHVMGLPLPEPVQQELSSAINRMVDCGYLQEDEARPIKMLPGLGFAAKWRLDATVGYIAAQKLIHPL